VAAGQRQVCGNTSHLQCFSSNASVCTVVATSGAQSYMPLFGHAYSLALPANATFRSFTVTARFRQPWSKRNSPAVAGLFHLISNVGGSSSAAGTGAWAARTPLGVAIAAAAGNSSISNYRALQCPAGTWTTFALSLDSVAGTLAVRGQCEGTLDAVDQVMRLSAASSSSSNTAAGGSSQIQSFAQQLLVGLYGLQQDMFGSISQIPKQGDDLAALALYTPALAGSSLDFAVQRAATAEQASGVSFLCLDRANDAKLACLQTATAANSSLCHSGALPGHIPCTCTNNCCFSQCHQCSKESFSRPSHRCPGD
jgi:hypothetical protein